MNVSPFLRAALDARELNAYYGTHYTAHDVMQMDDGDVEELLAFANAAGG